MATDPISTHDLELDQRVEVYTPNTGTYWGWIVDLHHIDGLVDLAGIAPDRTDLPTRVEAENIVRVVPHLRRGCTCPNWRRQTGNHVAPCPHAGKD